MTSIKKINIVILLLGVLCFATTKALFETVNVKIRNGSEIIELNWKRTAQNLGNKNLPVWYARKNREPDLIPQIFENMGDFIMYHDVEKSSAVVYFPKIGRFYGVIDTRFCVRELPLNNNDPDIVYDVGGPYIVSRNMNDEFFHGDHETLLHHLFNDEEMKYINSVIDSANSGSVPEPSSSSSHQHQLDHATSPSSSQRNQVGRDQFVLQNFAETRKSPPKILYPEILIFITNDIFTTFTKMNAKNGISLLLLYYLTYFNAIDMIFAKLATDNIAININIAGLVIETERNVFPYRIHRCGLPRFGTTFHRLHEDEVLNGFSQYINEYRNTFVEDSFDFFFVSTGYDIGRNLRAIHGKSSPLIDVYMLRALGKPYKNLLGSIVQRKGALNDYVTATREIAQLMDIRRDPKIQNSDNTAELCQAIMQDTNTHCLNCLKWSRNSQEDLQNYIRSNSNHCFLLNYPRSLHPYGQPVLSISPEDQCSCYKYPLDTLDLFYIASIPEGSCDKQLRCSYNQNAPTPLPMDGTPCGSRNKVCWRKECVAVETMHNIDDSDRTHRKV